MTWRVENSVGVLIAENKQIIIVKSTEFQSALLIVKIKV